MENYDGLFENNNAEPFDKGKWVEQKREEREAVYQMIDDAATAAVSSGEQFQLFLNVQARFDRYSASNVLLIAHQRPDATRLADFAAWKDAGVHIKKGESTINLLEPGKEYTKPDGTVKTSYKVKKVFDVSQTTALQRHETTVSRDKRLLLNALVDHRPCEIEVSENLPERVNVLYQPADNKIYVRQGTDAEPLFRGLAQEIAKVYLKQKNLNCCNSAFTAYSVAYVLCRKNQLSCEAFRFDRMPAEFGSMDAKSARRELGTIRRVSGMMIGDMNRVLDAYDRKQPQKQSTNRGER